MPARGAKLYRFGALTPPVRDTLARDRRLEKEAVRKVLVVYYSQTGQLRQVLDACLAPLEGDENIQVDWLRLDPDPAYPFPWTFFRFLDTFPECVQLEPIPMRPIEVDEGHEYDLVILGYTVWFLSPAPPITTFLRSPQGRRLLAGRPVVTLVACRNMWYTAQQTVRRLLVECGAMLSDHIAFVDRARPMATFITTPRWMLTGRRDRWLGLPPAGIDDEDIQRRGSRLGRALRQALTANRMDGQSPVLQGLEAVRVDEGAILSERVGYRSFRVWSRLVRAAGPAGSPARRAALIIYLIFLITMIITVVPISRLVRLAARPLMRQRLERLRLQHEGPSGSGNQRIREFES